MLRKWVLTTVLIGATACLGPDRSFGQGRLGGARGGGGGVGNRVGGGNPGGGIGNRVGGGNPGGGVGNRVGGGNPGGGVGNRIGGGNPGGGVGNRVGGGNPGGGIGNRVGGGNPGGGIGNRVGGGNPGGGVGNRIGGGNPGGGIGNRVGGGNPVVGGRPNIGPGNNPVLKGGTTPGTGRVVNRIPTNNQGGAGNQGAANRFGLGNGPGVGKNPGIGSGVGVGRNPGVGSGVGIGRNPGIGSGVGVGKNPGIGSGVGIGRNPGIGSGPGIGRNPGIGRGPGVGNGPGIGNGNIGNRIGNGNIGNRIGNNNIGNRIGGGNNIIAGNNINPNRWNPNNFAPAYAPLAWGLAGAGLGALAYSSGYVPYENPYYAPVEAPIYDYGQPVPVDYSVLPTDDAAPIEQPAAGNAQDELFQQAVTAFQKPDYAEALDLANQGIREFPTDPAFHEFRGLVQFAKGDYQQAAATIHSVLAVGPGWNWTTMSGMYSDIGNYTDQLRALEGHVRQNPEDAAPRFLLGYHYMTTGHPENAAKQFAKVAALQPNDQLASNLHQMLSPPETTFAEDSATQPPTDGETPPAIDPKTLPGTWKATRDDGSKFQLTLSDDDKFEWQFAHGDQKPVGFGGTYQLDGNTLALQQADGQALVAMLTPDGDSQLNFKLVGAPNSDPGLIFQR